jgi:hypothetical protein
MTTAWRAAVGIHEEILRRLERLHSVARRLEQPAQRFQDQRVIVDDADASLRGAHAASLTTPEERLPQKEPVLCPQYLIPDKKVTHDRHAAVMRPALQGVASIARPLRGWMGRAFIG